MVYGCLAVVWGRFGWFGGGLGWFGCLWVFQPPPPPPPQKNKKNGSIYPANRTNCFVLNAYDPHQLASDEIGHIVLTPISTTSGL